LEISFPSAKLAKSFNDARQLTKRYGAQRAQKMRRRLDDLAAAKCLDDMRTLPGRCHELRGDRAGTFSIDLDGPYRLLFEPADDPVPLKVDGGIEWKLVEKIMILEVEDYHG